MRRLVMTLCFCVAAYCLAQESPDAPLTIRCEAFANWQALGETAVFRKASGKISAGVSKLHVRVFDYDGANVEDSLIDASQFKESGWRWTPLRPGFYSLEFSLVSDNGTETPVAESVKRKVGDKEKTFTYDSQQLAVLPSATRPPENCPPFLGASVGWGVKNKEQVEEQMRLASLVGMSFIRLHPLRWGGIEKKEGVYDWTEPDWWMESAKRRGFKVIANPWGTPKWAATDQRTEVAILPRYMMSMPKDVECWSRFLKAAAARYPEIHDWAIWNEPNETGLTCFWSGTPEQFMELNKAGYEAIKSAKPNDVVWLNCPSEKLYEIMLRNGDGKYFDKLEIHGKWMDFENTYGAIAKNFGVKKPWAGLEWHAILTGAAEPPPSEAALAKSMLLDMMNMLRAGSEYAAVHHMLDRSLSNDMLEFYRSEKNSWFIHTAGLFKATTALEPRLPAVALRNFMDCFRGKIVYRDGFSFSSSRQCAALLSSDSGNLLAVWTVATSPAQIDPLIARATSPDAEIIDWFGRVRKEGAALELQPEQIYFIKNPSLGAMAEWTKAQALKKIVQNDIKLDNTFNALYRQGRLFDGAMNIIEPEALRWYEAANYNACSNKLKTDGFAAKFAVAFDVDGMDLLVDVADAKHCQNSTGVAQWLGDGVQFSIDTLGKGHQENSVEFCACLGPKGPVLWKQAAASLDGQMPMNYSSADSEVKHSAIKIIQTPAGLLYKIRVEGGELFPLKLSGGNLVRFSMLVNNNDGAGREGWLEWGSGIGACKAPSFYGNLTPEVRGEALLDQRGLDRVWGAGLLSLGAEGCARMDSSAGVKDSRGVAALATRMFAPTPCVRYSLSFKARGDINLNCMVNFSDNAGGKTERTDLLNAQSLDPKEWKTFSVTFIAPDVFCANTSISLFAWRQNGFLEVEDFLLKPSEK